MAFFINDRGRKLFVVQCKRCNRDVPAGVTETPVGYIIVRCILCQEIRRYLPSQVGWNYPHYEVLKILRGQRRG